MRSRKPRRPVGRMRRTYQQFLLSAYWQDVRMQVLKRDRYRCQDCGKKRHLEVHHLSYAHHGKEDRYLEDLVTLCKSCHKHRHVQKAG